MFINTPKDVRYSPFPRAMSCSKFSYTTEANRRAFWFSLIMPSALIHSPGLVLDVNLANVSIVALVVLQAARTSPALAKTSAPTRLFNDVVFMSQPPNVESHKSQGGAGSSRLALPLFAPRHRL